MTKEESIEKWVIPALKNTWNEKRCNEVLEALEQEPCDELDFVQPHKKIAVNLEVCKMREATQEEREGVEQYIDSIAEPCEDCVSRKELLKIYEDRFLELQKIKHLKDNKGVEDRQMGVNYCINILKEMPPVTPVEKVGHWIMHIDDLFPVESTMECDQCHEHQPITIDDNYCPSCGAKMREVKNKNG